MKTKSRRHEAIKIIILIQCDLCVQPYVQSPHMHVFRHRLERAINSISKTSSGQRGDTKRTTGRHQVDIVKTSRIDRTDEAAYSVDNGRCRRFFNLNRE